MSEYTFPTRTDATSTATAGKDYLIYLNTGTTEAAPTWTLLGGQRSGDLNREADEIDASHKTSGGWKSTLPGLRSWSIDLETVYLAGFVTGWGSITECSLSTPHDDVATLKGTISGDGPLSEQSKG